MNSRNLTIICILIIVGAMAICSSVILTSAEDTCISVLSGSSLYNGDTVYVQLTTENGTPIANQQVNVTLVDGNGERNTLNLVTDSEGRASFELNGVAVGSYTLECIFGGSDGYRQSNTTTTLEINEKTTSQNSDSNSDWAYDGGSFYSVQLSNGHYKLIDKSSGRILGYGDRPYSLGYH